MGTDRAAAAGTQSLAEGRAEAQAQPAVLRGHPLGPAQRGAVERPAGAIPVAEHVLAAAARLGSPGRVAGGLAGAAGRTRRPASARLGRVFRRRELFARKKRGDAVGKTKRGKGTKWLVVADGAGLPLGVSLASATPAEVTLIARTLETVRVPRKRGGAPRRKPKRLIADKGYDADWLRILLWSRGIELICPHRRNRKRPALQDGRPLRRYRRRWKIERTIAWLGYYRRLLIRWERNLNMYSAFMHVACLMIAVRWL